MFYVQVTMGSLPMAEAIVLPFDGSLPYIGNFFLITPGTGALSINDCNEDEELLGLVPQVWVPERWDESFSWNHRSVAVISADDIEDYEGDWRENYMLYTCRDEEARTYPRCSSM